MINKAKFNEIIDGWKNLLFKDNPEVEEIAKERISICVDCENFTEISTCNLCGCFMPAKTRSITSRCGLDYWNKKY